MTDTLVIDNLAFEVRRSTRRKTVGITVERDSSLIAHLPAALDFGAAERIIRDKLVWVHQKIAGKPTPVGEGVFRRPEFVDGEGFYYFGRHYRLRLVDKAPGGPSTLAVRFNGDYLLFRRDQVASGDQRLAEHHTRVAHRYLNSAVRRWKAIVGVEPNRFVNILDLGFRWGSCSSDGTLNFHWRIVQLPTRVIDYIVVHELCRLKIRDHSSAFWSELKRVIPDYQEHREWLRKYGASL